MVNAYRAFLEEVQVHNSVAGGLGRGYKKPCSIPQGCPLSMAITALLMRPWILKMQELGATGRVLADDMLVVAEGPGHAMVFEQAFDEHTQDVAMHGSQARTKQIAHIFIRYHDAQLAKRAQVEAS